MLEQKDSTDFSSGLFSSLSRFFFFLFTGTSDSSSRKEKYLMIKLTKSWDHETAEEFDLTIEIYEERTLGLTWRLLYESQFVE